MLKLSTRSKRIILAVPVFFIPAVFHALALKWPQISVPETPLQHGAFVLINLWFCVALVAMLPNWLLESTLAALTVHQFVVHGQMLVIAAINKTFDFQSASALIGMVVAWGYLVYERAEVKSELGKS